MGMEPRYFGLLSSQSSSSPIFWAIKKDIPANGMRNSICRKTASLQADGFALEQWIQTLLRLICYGRLSHPLWLEIT